MDDNLKYTQVYIAEYGNVKGNVDINSFGKKNIAFDIGANKYGEAVFKNPSKALKVLKRDYKDGIKLIQREFNLLPLNRFNYKSYGTFGWQVTIGTEEEKEQTKKVNEDMKDLLKEMCDEIKEVNEVKFSNKLKSHPVCLTTKGDVSIEMQKVFDAMPNDMGIKAQTILEINEKHPIAEKLKDLYANDKEEFKKYTKILYSEARMIAGLPIDNPTEISRLICEVISK